MSNININAKNRPSPSSSSSMIKSGLPHTNKSNKAAIPTLQSDLPSTATATGTGTGTGVSNSSNTDTNPNPIITNQENQNISQKIISSQNLPNTKNPILTPKGILSENAITPDDKPFSYLPNTTSPRPSLQARRPQGLGPNMTMTSMTPLNIENNNFNSTPGSMNSSGLDLSFSMSLELETNLLNKQYNINRRAAAAAAATTPSISNRNNDNSNNNSNNNNNNNNNNNQSKFSPRSKVVADRNEKLNSTKSGIRSQSQSGSSSSQSPLRSGGDSRGGKSPNQNSWNFSQNLKNDIPNGVQLRRSTDDVILGTSRAYSFLILI